MQLVIGAQLVKNFRTRIAKNAIIISPPLDLVLFSAHNPAVLFGQIKIE